MIKNFKESYYYYYLFQYILSKTHLKLGITRFVLHEKQKGQKKSKKIFKKLLTYFDLNDIIIYVISSQTLRVLKHKIGE